MLSRVADNLYWMGRYLERAEHTARLAGVNLDLAIDRTPRSFEEPLGADGDATAFGETVADTGGEKGYEHVLDTLVVQEVRHLADRLDERERTVLRGHYGFGRPPQTLNEIGSDLGLTAERIRQIENKALEKLREAAAQPSTGTRSLESRRSALTTSGSHEH